MRIIFFVLLWVVFVNKATGQRPLSIGDQVPDVFLKEIFNHKLKKGNLSKLRSKLTILDFWSSTCSSCIEFFPHMQRLQDTFRNQLQVVLVNTRTNALYDNPMRTRAILNRVKNNSGTPIKLPVVFSSKELDALFPCQSIPHEVWIDEKGKVIAITGTLDVTGENIRKLLANEKVRMRTKTDVLFNLSIQPLASLIYGTGRPADIEVASSYILIKGFMSGLGTQTGVRRAPGATSPVAYTGLYMTNAPVIEMYKTAFEKIAGFPANRIIIDAPDKEIFMTPLRSDDAFYDRMYSYEVLSPATTRNTLLSQMQKDLENYFGATARIEKRKVRCLVISITEQSRNAISKVSEQKFEFGRAALQKMVRAYPLHSLLNEFDRLYFRMPLVDETGMNEKVDMDFPSTITQESLIQSLIRYGFVLHEEERELEVAVVSQMN